MPVRLSAAVVDSLLLGPENRRRQLQDFPVLGDVWARFADRPGEIHDLLILPTRERPTGEVVSLISGDHGGEADKGCSVAYLQDLVVASFGLDHLYRVLIPATGWWDQIQDSCETLPSPDDLAKWIRLELADTLRGRETAAAATADAAAAAQGADGERAEQARVAEAERKEFEALKTNCHQVAKLGLVLGVFLAAAEREAGEAGPDGKSKPLPSLAEAVETLTAERIVALGVDAIQAVMARHQAFQAADGQEWNGVIFQVTLNREAEAALAESVPAIKADAARMLFSISCRDIGWAVLDSGIDYTHAAFREHDPKAKRPHRVKAAYDFRRIRAILGVRAEDVDALAAEIFEQNELELDKIKELLVDVAKDRIAREPLDWRKIRQLIELDVAGESPKAERPTHPHGTHVAGIIGANWLEEGEVQAKLAGVCPDIALFDFRVLGSSLGDSEFAVTAALQFIRFLNEQSGARIHGVNMSLAIRHNVRNYACGRTPVCVEAEALVANGVVVVAAAGNRGYQLYQLADSTTFESYAASSITDPGNAEGVITVGATHRQWPHTYGVSFFSSRGPTGDGRLKPDLLAPGEKIVSCVPGGRQDQMDGTSMAAPHVSGAAALLMSRHKELKGQPGTIKRILCETATDLNRERSFQGHGMVDVLRAIQSI
jgi:serine protease AprX